MKNILKFIIEPIRFIGSRGFAESVIKFFDRHEWLIYLVAFFIALLAVFFIYIQPVL
ncbi:hypothetical protein [Acholeplasma granularum]|uniref:hypothetical protein n=1 Tax=Acholeplasma granularum TaxID=264635 RepID=UPI0004AF0E11|nr:hypothetical protein [Acholeplasma granularum]